MENCSITKLIGSVDKKDLPKFGFLRFEIISRFAQSSFFLKSQTESVEWFGYDTSYNVQEHGIVSPTNAIAFLQGEVTRILDVEKEESINEIYATGISTSVDPSLSFLQVMSDGKLPNVTTITITWSGGLGGYINNLFSKFTKLATLNLTGDSAIRGSMESLLESHYAAGRTAGTLDITANNTQVTMNNAAVSGTYNVTFNATGCVVSLNGSVVRTYNNGVWS